MSNGVYSLKKIFVHLYPLPPAPLLELAEDKDVRQLLEVGRQLFSNSNITVRINILHIILIHEILYQFVENQ